MRTRCSIIGLVILSLVAWAKEKKPPVPPASPVMMQWPETGAPVLRFAFTPFQQMGAFANQKTYTTEVTVQNLWSKTIESAEFQVLVFDADRARVGETWLRISNLAPGEVSKQALNVSTVGTPQSMKLEPRNVPAEFGPPKPPHVISLTVYSVPAGASLKVDGKEAGVTPIQVQVGDGQHVMEFTKEGFALGRMIHNVGPSDVSGGSVTAELAGLTHDTVELRDGSTVIGDVQSVDASKVIVTVGGQDREFERNEVQKIMLIQREPPPPQPVKKRAQPPK